MITSSLNTAKIRLLIVSAMVFCSTLFAADVVKTDDASNTLDQPGSWIGGAVPSGTDNALWDSTISASRAYTLGTDATWGGIKILSPLGLVTINAGSNLTLNGVNGIGIDMSNALASLTLGNSVTLNANQTWSVAAGQTLTSSGLIAGGFGITKEGPGTLSLITTAKTYTGITTVNGGTLSLGLGGGTGVIRGTLTVNSAGTVLLNANNSLGFTAGVKVDTLNINGGLVNNVFAGDNGWAIAINMTGGTLQSNAGTSAVGATQLFSLGGGSSINTLPSATSATISGRVNLRETNPNGLLVINVAQGTVPNGQDLVFSAALTTGSTTNVPLYGVTKTGAGNMVMAGAGRANFTGPFNILGGTLTCGIGFTGTTSVLGVTNNAAAGARTITVGSGATMNWTINNVLIGGGSSAPNLPTIALTGSTLTSTRYNALGNITLNAATLTQSATDAGNYEGYQFLGSVTVSGTTPSFISTGNGKANHLLNGAGTIFDVADVTGNTATDLLISAPLRDSSGDYGLGAGVLIKNGVGTLELSGANVYTGATTVNAGTLVVTGTILGAPIVNGGTIQFNSVNTYTGNTVVNAGALALGAAGSIASSPVITIGNGGLLDITAAGMTLAATQTLVAGHAAPATTDVSGNLTSNGTIDVAGTGTVGTATINGNLILNDASKIKLDLSNNTAAGNDLLVVSGNLTLNGVVSITPNLLNGGLATGTYTLITYTGTLTGNASNLTISLPAGAGTSRQSFTLNTATAGSVRLVVSGAPSTDTWTGAISNVWDVKTTANWTNPVPNDGLYFDLDNVVFGTSTVGGITLNTPVSPSSMIFNNTLTTAYAITGTGAIGGSTGLVKNNTGTLTLGTANTFTGPVTINNGSVSVATLAASGAASALGAGSSISLGDATNKGTLQYTGTSINTNRVLTLNAGGGQVDVVGGTTLTATAPIGGAGALTKVGAGTLALGSAGTFPGGTSINAGTLSLQNNAALGAGTITLGGGTLQLAKGSPSTPGIGIHFSQGRNAAEIDNVTGTAGVFPIANWNNIPGITGSNVALVDNNAAATSALVSFSGGAVNYSSFGASQANQDQQLLNPYLDTNATFTTNTITVTNVPYPAYRVYVYFGSDGNGRTGHVSVGATTIYFSTNTNPFVGYVQATATTLAGATASNYAVFDNLGDSTLTVTQVRDSNNCGVMAVEIVSLAATLANSVAVNANSAVDLTGAGSGSVGTLTIGAQTLSLTGGSTALNSPFTFSTGAVTLTGNPTFSPGLNGTGVGVLTLGALNDGGTPRTITVGGPGTLVLGSPATSLGAGTQVNVPFGSLVSKNATALGSNAQINLGNATTFFVNTNQTISSLAPTGVAGSVVLGTSVLTIGNSENLSSAFNGAISGTSGGLTKAGTGSLTLSGALAYSGTTTVLNGALVITGSIAGNPTSGVVQVGGAAASGTPALAGTGTLSGATTIDGANGGANGHLAPGVNTSGNLGGIGTITTGALTLNSGAVLDFDFGTPGSGTPSTGGISDSVAINGNLIFPASGSITLNLGNNAGAGGNGSIGNGTYKLFTFSGQVVNFSAASSFTVGTTPLTGRTYIFTVVGNELDLTILSGVLALTWNGASSSLWNTAANNWFNSGTSATTTYLDGGLSTTIFQDAKLGGAGNVTNNSIVIQAAGVSPISVTFNNTSGGVPYTFTNPGGTTGITGTTGIVMAGTGTVSLQAANTYTGLTALNAGVLRISDNAAMGSTSGVIAPLTFNGGILGYLSGATNTDFSARLVTIGAGGATLDTNGQTVSLANPIGNNGSGKLTLADSNATPGKLILTGSNSYTGGTTINGGVLQLGNGTVDGTVIGAIQNGTGLIYNVVGSASNDGVISGPGQLTKDGAGVLALNANNTYLGTTTINAGTLSVKGLTSLSTAPVILNGGTLQLASGGDKIGINFSSGRVGTPEIEDVTGQAGFVPMTNWNNIQGLSGTNIALKDNSGATGATMTFSGAPNAYSVYGVAQAGQDAQLLNGYLDNNATSSITVTISNIPYPSYRVYVYVGSDGNNRPGHVTVGGTSSYFLTNANPFPGYIQATGTSTATANAANYAFFDNLTGPTLTIFQAPDGGNCGICGIEIVSNSGFVLGNSVSVTGDSTIDVSGIGATLGGLSIGGKTLNVTGSGSGMDTPYLLTMGNATLSGNSSFNVNNNGTGTGTLSLGSLDGGAIARSLTFAGTGAVTLTAPAVSLITGTQVTISSGALNSNDAMALGSNAQVNLFNGGSFNLGASQTISSLATFVNGGNVRLNGNSLTVGNSENLSTVFAGVISGGGALIKAGTGKLELSGANTLSAATSVTSGVLRVSGSIIGVPASGAVSVGGAAGSGTPTLSGTGTIGGVTTIDSVNGGAAGHLAPGANTTANTGDIGTLATGALTLNAGAVLDFDFGTAGAGLPSAGGSADSVAVNGNLIFPATGSVVLNLSDNAGASGKGSIGVGTYRLFSFTGQALNFNSSTSITIGTSALAGKSYIFTLTGSEIDMTISSGVKNLTWTGAQSALWNTAALNWFNTTTSAADTYADNVSFVTFQDALLGGAGNVTNSTITIQAAGVTPSFITFTNTGGGVPYVLKNAGGSIGISGSTGVQISGSGSVTFQSPNTYTSPTQLNAGRLTISDNADLGASSGTIAGLTFNGGTLQFATGATNTDFSGRTVTIQAGNATIDTNGQTVSLANPIGNNGAGRLALNDLNATPGKLILAGANTYQGSTLIARGTLQLGDGTSDGSVVGNITDNDTLIYNVAGSSTLNGVISGTGSVQKSGLGTMVLGGANTYTGTTTLSGGTLSVSNKSALGTGLVNLNGGTLQLTGNAPGTGIGINFSTGRTAAEINDVTGTSGVYPIGNWNNVQGVTGTNIALNDSNGAALPTFLTFTGAAVNYSSFGAAQANQDAQLLNSYLDTNATQTTNTITITNVPYPAYRVYVYFGSDGNGRTGHVTVGATTYYFVTDTNPFVGYVQATSTVQGAGQPSNYALFDNVTGSTLTISQVRESNNCGVMGVEIVSISSTLNNSLAVNANSTIDLAGTNGAALGAVSIGSWTLAVTGQGTAANANYVLSMGAITLTGNPVLTISNGGAGAGMLTLKALSDGGTPRTLTVNPGVPVGGALVLTASAPGLADGTAVSVAGGTLRLGAANVLGAKPVITLTQPAANLDGNGQQLGGTVRGIGTIISNLLVGSGASVWPGSRETVIPPLATDETLSIAPIVNVDLSGGGKLKIAITKNGGTVNKQILSIGGSPLGAGTLTLGPSSILSLGVGTGTYAGTGPNGGVDIPIVTGALGFPAITTKFGSVIGLPPNWSVVYQYIGTDLTGDPSVANPADTIVIRSTAGGVTPVTVGAFAAIAEGAGVRVTWESISEFQNAGFNVYRRETGGAWTRVNPALIAGRISSSEAKVYDLYDWPQPGTYDYKLECVSIFGTRDAQSRLAGPVPVDANSTASELSAAGLESSNSSVDAAVAIERGSALSSQFTVLPEARVLAEKEAQTVVNGTDHRATSLAFDANGTLVRPAQVREIQAPRAPAGGQLNAVAEGSALASHVAARSVSPTAAVRWFASNTTQARSFTAAKAIYNAAGVLKIPQTMLPSGFDFRHVTIQREGRTLRPLALASDGLIVFAPGYQDEYTDKDALFLRATNAPTDAGLETRAQGLFASTQAVNTAAPATARVDFHDVYFDFTLRPYTFAPWFSGHYLTGGSTQNFTINTPFASSGSASLTVNLWSLTQTGHALQVLVNGQPVGQAVWSGGDKMMQLTFPVSAGVLTAGNNLIDLVTPAGDGTEQIALLHSLSLDYARALDGSSPVQLLNPSASAQLFELNGLPSAGAWVVDARFPDRAILAPYETLAETGGTYRLRFSAPSGGTGQFLVVPAGQENLPVAVSKRTVKPVKTGTYLAVGPSQFGPGVQPLLTLRTKEGLRASFADQEQLFDYYNSGRYGPAAIQNAIRSTLPRYLLLLGRTTYDYRNYSGLNVDPLCPTFLVPTTFWAQATSDSMFGDLGRGYPEIAVGRLPVNDATELNATVRRILSYPGLPSSGIRAQAVADRADPLTGDFSLQADAIARALPDAAWQSNYLGMTHASSPEVTAAMTDAANGGADMLVYVGHGNSVRLGAQDPRILEVKNLQSWTGNIVLLQATCAGNWFANNQTGFKSIAIQALSQPQGGISASIGTSTFMTADCGADFISKLIGNANLPGTRWGDALLKTQKWAFQNSSASGFYYDLSRTEQILGDPAMRVFEKPGSHPAAPVAPTGGSVPPALSGQF